MSMTDLKALALVWVMGARKLPAAPALFRVGGVVSVLLLTRCRLRRRLGGGK